MDKGRKSRVQKSVFTTLLMQVTTLVCGLIVPRYLLNAFGSEAYGATTSISQFLSYITLLEGGIGGVARASLYKPLVDNDIKKISAIMYELKRFFRSLALVSVVYTLFLAVSFKSISHISCYSWFSSFLLVVAMAISTFGQYFIGIAYSALIQADQRVYLINMLSIVTTILNTIMVVILIYIGSGLIFVKLVSSCVFLIKPTAMWIYVNNRYGLIKDISKDKSLLEQKWTGLGQHIAYYIHSNTDVAVLTFLVNLKIVSVYSVYHMVTSNIQNVVFALCSGMEPLFGDMIAKNERNKLSDIFNIYETMLSIASSILFSTVYVMILPFIMLYTRGVYDVNYLQPLFAILITTASVVYCLRYPYQSVVTAAGHFKQTRAGAYGEALLNIIISIILVWQYGLIGVAIGTIAAIGFRFVYLVIYLSKNIMNRRVSLFIKRSIFNILCILIDCLLCEQIISQYDINSYFTWIICAIFVFSASTFLVCFFNLIVYKQSLLSIIKIIHRKK